MTSAPCRQKYGVIYADPPWAFTRYSEKGKGRSADAHYQCMTFDEICNIPVADWAARDCVLFLWVINSMLPEGNRLPTATRHKMSKL